MKIKLQTSYLAFCLIIGCIANASSDLNKNKSVYQINETASSVENILPNDGYFCQSLPLHLKAAKELPADCKISLKSCQYEKSDYVLEIDTTAKKGGKNIQLSTVKTPITNKFMVVEVMARVTSKGANPRFAVIAIGSNFKYISHKHYNLTGNWRKYVAVVEIPKDNKNKSIFWGRVDIPNGICVQIGRIAVYSMDSNAKILNAVEEVKADTQKKGAVPGASAYRTNVNADTGENILPNDGYFSKSLPLHLKAAKELPADCKISLKSCQYEKSDSVLEIDTTKNKKKGYLQLSTVKTPITNNLMVVEVMARVTSKGANPHFAVIAIGSNYKYISHKHYNLTENWRKYVAVVEIPKDNKNKNIFWGRVDIPNGICMQIGRIAVYSMVNNTKIAGMADDAETEAKKKTTEPNLNNSKTQIPTATKLISSQIGNQNQIRKIKPRLSSEIEPNNIAGAALCGYPVFECPAQGEAYGFWSPWWVIADPSIESAVVQKCFSSAMRSPNSGGESLTVSWNKPVKINRVRLTPRDEKLTGFPLDWHLEISNDGKIFREVFRTKNYTQKGSIPQIEFPVQEVAAVRMTADKIRLEGKNGYFQLRRLEAFSPDGKNLALPQFGASAEANNPLSMPLLSHQRFYDHIVRCGIKTVLIDITASTKAYNSINDGIAFGSRGYENITAFMKFLKKHGVNTIVRLGLGLHRQQLTADQVKDLPQKFATQYLPHIRSWKGLVKSYSLAGEENQYRTGKVSNIPVKDYMKCYNDACIACAKEIRKIEPDAEISVSTALFDFGWTEGLLKYGVGNPGLVDTFSVHIYRENDPLGSYPEKCYSFFVDGRRGLESERMFTKAEDEIKAYLNLLKKYNPNLKMSSNETCMKNGTYCRGMASTETGQAKYVSRQFIMHQFYKIGPNLWWSFISAREKDRGLLWGMVDISNRERKVHAWHSYSYFNAIFDNSWQPDKEFALSITPADERFYSYTFKRGNEWMAAAWIAVSMRDKNTGKEADLLIPGKFSPDTEVECIDMLNGSIQKMNVVHTAEGLLLKGVILRDYALVFRSVKK